MLALMAVVRNAFLVVPTHMGLCATWRSAQINTKAEERQIADHETKLPPSEYNAREPNQFSTPESC